jgi:hypothetical protein
MSNAVLGTAIAIAIATVYLGIRTIVDTRRRYYHDYQMRKGRK